MTMQTTFRALSALLSYPTPDLIDALPEIRALVAADRRLPRRDAAALDALCATLAAADPFDAQERYVDTFDRGRATSLNLFEHVHGDSRDRGTAMLDLKGVYERAGYAFVGSELPDYVPAVLEFLGTQPHAAAEELLGECAHILRRIGEALAERDSPYAAVFAALLAAVGADGLAPPKARRDSPRPEKSIDEEWAEEPVIFGPGAAPSCGAAAPASSVIQFMPRPAAPL
jgi:nitrate reductase delta subunit